MSRALNQRGFICAREAVGRGFIEGFAHDVVESTLRGLRHHDLLAGNGERNHGAVCFGLDFFDRIHRRNSGNGGARFFHRGNHRLNGFDFHEGTHSIVHQHNIIVFGSNSPQRIGYRFLAVLAPFYHLHRLFQAFVLELPPECFHFILAQGHTDFIDLVAGGKLAQGMNQDRSAAQLGELFRRPWALLCTGAHARPQSRRRIDDKNLHANDLKV